MDDEALIRIAAIACGTLAVIVIAVVVAVAWHTGISDHDANGPELATIYACTTLPSDERQACLANEQEKSIIQACVSAENDSVLYSASEEAPISQTQSDIRACIVTAGGKSK